MLILECTDRRDARSFRHRIGVIGTCRVHNPFLSLALRGSVKKLRRDFNAFTHSGDEALQHIRYTRGELDVPHDLAPFIFGMPQVPALSQSGIEVARHLDLLVVEVCTLNRIRYREFSFQPNFFARYFVSTRRGSLLPWWRLASRGLPGADDLANKLIVEWRQNGEPFSELEEDILRNAVCWQVDYKDCRDEMSRLAEAVDRPIIFVPHFSIEHTGRLGLQERDQIRRYVICAAEEIGESCLDATPLLREVGDQFARKNEGRDLHHYSKEFEDYLGNAYLEMIQDRFPRDMAVP